MNKAKDQYAKPHIGQQLKPVEECNSMPVQFGKLKAIIFGGPFHRYMPGQRRVISVKMAVEIDRPCDINIPTEDFNVPAPQDMHAGVHKALQAILDGNDLYAGCMGGVGRTGLFMACMAKVMMAYQDKTGDWVQTPVFCESDSHLFDPVAYVRKHYDSHAVETAGQRSFIADFDPKEHVEFLCNQLHPKAIERVIEHEVIKEVPTRIEVPIYYWNPVRAFWQFWADASKP